MGSSRAASRTLVVTPYARGLLAATLVPVIAGAAWPLLLIVQVVTVDPIAAGLADAIASHGGRIVDRASALELAADVARLVFACSWPALLLIYLVDITGRELPTGEVLGWTAAVVVANAIGALVYWLAVVRHARRPRLVL